MAMLDPRERSDRGQERQAALTAAAPPEPATLFEASWRDYVFSEIWTRPGLDQRARRWLTLVGVANSSAHTLIHSHVWSAMKSGNATPDEMYEFVLQYAVHAGWPRASFVQGVVMQQAARVAKGLSYID